MYQSLCAKAVKAVGFGIIVEIGSVGGQRLVLLKKILRSKDEPGSEKTLKIDLLRWLAVQLKKCQVANW